MMGVICFEKETDVFVKLSQSSLTLFDKHSNLEFLVNENQFPLCAGVEDENNNITEVTLQTYSC